MKYNTIRYTTCQPKYRKKQIPEIPSSKKKTRTQCKHDYQYPIQIQMRLCKSKDNTISQTAPAENLHNKIKNQSQNKEIQQTISTNWFYSFFQLFYIKISNFRHPLLPNLKRTLKWHDSVKYSSAILSFLRIKAKIPCSHKLESRIHIHVSQSIFNHTILNDRK